MLVQMTNAVYPLALDRSRLTCCGLRMVRLTGKVQLPIGDGLTISDASGWRRADCTVGSQRDFLRLRIAHVGAAEIVQNYRDKFLVEI